MTKSLKMKIDDIDFYQKQFRIVLRNCGFINPEDIDEYIAREGYQALGKAITEMTPDQVVEELGIFGNGHLQVAADIEQLWMLRLA